MIARVRVYERRASNHAEGSGNWVRNHLENVHLTFFVIILKYSTLLLSTDMLFSHSAFCP